MEVVKFKLNDQWFTINNIEWFELKDETLSLYGEHKGIAYFVTDIRFVTEAKREE